MSTYARALKCANARGSFQPLPQKVEPPLASQVKAVQLRDELMSHEVEAAVFWRSLSILGRMSLAFRIGLHPIGCYFSLCPIRIR